MTDRLPEDASEVRPVVEAVLGEVPAAVERQPSFAGNRVFRALVREDHLFLKFGSAADIGRECAALALASGAGVPVPRVEAVDLSGEVSPYPLIILAQVPGRPLDGSEPILDQVGALMDRWHAVRLEGFGLATPDQGGRLRGENDSWPDALDRKVRAAGSVAAAGLVPAEFVERVALALERMGRSLEMQVGQFLHGDFHPRHVYASGATIKAVIDWGDASVGDPDYDLARV